MMSRQVALELPRVIHYRERFPVLSATFIRETVTHHQRYESIVLAHVRIADVPVDGVSLIVSPASLLHKQRRVTQGTAALIRPRLYPRDREPAL
jgi:hypothetical protein